MYIQLTYRKYGSYNEIKHIEIPCEFSKVYLGEDNIDEKLLFESIPKGWLPTAPRKILLAVADKNGSTGQSNLKAFSSWTKCSDSYVLELHKEPLDWWSEKQ